MTSNTLNEIYGTQPDVHDYELQRKITDMLVQFDPKYSYLLKESRIPTILEEIESLADGTNQKLAQLHAETLVLARMNECQGKIAILKKNQQALVDKVLMMAA